MKAPTKATPVRARQAAPETQVIEVPASQNLLDACHNLMVLTGAQHMRIEAVFHDGAGTAVETSQPMVVNEEAAEAAAA